MKSNMDELIFGGNKYISSKRAARLAGYTTDYLGQLCRADKMDCRFVGRNWYINEREIENQKKSFKKEEHTNRAKEIEYRKIDFEPMYYSNDARSNYPEINKAIHNEIEGIEDIRREAQKVPVHIVERPAINIRKYKPNPLQRQNRQIIRRQPMVPQVHRGFPMLAVVASVLILAGTLLIAGTFTLEQVVRYSSKDKTDIDTNIQLANIIKSL